MNPQGWSGGWGGGGVWGGGGEDDTGQVSSTTVDESRANLRRMVAWRGLHRTGGLTSLSWSWPYISVAGKQVGRHRVGLAGILSKPNSTGTGVNGSHVRA